MQTLNETVNKRINEIHDKYLNIISPFIMQIEVLDGEHPVEIMNEIRAVFGHLSKCHLSSDDNFIERNLSKADSHIKRAIIDCFKYLCFAYENKYIDFDKKFKKTDLSDIDNGEFLPNLCLKRKRSMDKLVNAKVLELSQTDDDTLFQAFEEAYNTYADVYNYIGESYAKLERVRRKARNRNVWAIIGYCVGVAGLLASIVSIIL